MRHLLLLGLLAGLLLALPMAAFANEDRDIAEEMMEEWIDTAEDEGYIVLDQHVDRIDEDHIMTWTIDLEPGSYAIFAEGGINIVDLDLFGYYEDEYEDGDDPFLSDVLDDNVPILEFDLRRAETIVAVVQVAEWERGEDRGYYCILFCQEDED